MEEASGQHCPEHQQAQGLEAPGICDQGGEVNSRTGQRLCKQQPDLGRRPDQGWVPSAVTRGYSLEGFWTWGSRHHWGEGGVEDSCKVRIPQLKVLPLPTCLPRLEMRTVPGETDKAKRKTS